MVIFHENNKSVQIKRFLSKSTRVPHAKFYICKKVIFFENFDYRATLTNWGVRTRFSQSERGYSVRHGAYVRCFNQSERGYGVRHGVYVRFSPIRARV